MSQDAFPHYDHGLAAVAVSLTNSLNVASGRDAWQTPDDLSEFISVQLGEADRGQDRLTDSDLRFARALRARFRGVWTAGSAEAAAAAINGIIELVSARPRLVAGVDGSMHLHFEADDDRPVRRLGAVAALGLSAALIDAGWERFGTCASSACDDVYVDTSRNRSRRYCTDRCTTRESVAAYRARQKAPGWGSVRA